MVEGYFGVPGWSRTITGRLRREHQKMNNFDLIGKIVHFWYAGMSNESPMAAIINSVTDELRVSVTLLEHTGSTSGRFDVPLVRDGSPRPENVDFCELRPQ